MATSPRIEVQPSTAVCRLCGMAYGKLNGFFYRSYAQIYKGNGYMSVCKKCVDDVYEDFLRECGDMELACHQTCRKFNIYWNQDVYNGVLKGSSHRTIMSGYLARVNVVKYQGKSYDDFLREISMLWEIPHAIEETPAPSVEEAEPPADESEEEDDDALIEVADSVKIEWGPGYTNKQYVELEERRKYWVNDLKQRNIDTDDINVATLLRQIVATEIEINYGRANGTDVDKKVNTLNTLVGNAILKPSQKKSDADVSIETTPLGVWINRFENEKPLPEDENESVLRKFVHTWMFGHLAKMVGLRNSYTKMYEDEIERLRVEKPEYANEEDDELITSAFGEDVFEDG